MSLETFRVNTKLKFTRPSAGLEIPSIFCSTHGPTGVVVVEFDVTDCHGQPNLIDGRWMPIPTRWNAADRANRTPHPTARGKIRPSTTSAAIHLYRSGIHRRRGRRPPGPHPEPPPQPEPGPRPPRSGRCTVPVSGRSPANDSRPYGSVLYGSVVNGSVSYPSPGGSTPVPLPAL